MLELIHQSIKTLTFAASTNMMLYQADQDCFLTRDIGNFSAINRVYRDGTTIEMGILQSSGGFSLTGHPREGIAVATRSPGGTFFLDPITWNYDFNRPFTSAVTVDSGQKGLYLRDASGSLKYYKLLSNRLIRIDALTDVTESDVVITSNVFPVGGVQWAGGNKVLVTYGDGEIKIVDVVTFEITLDSFIDVARIFSYDTKRDLIVTVRLSDGVVQTWATNIVPATLSVLSFSPGAFERYQTEQVSVTVLGSNGELVPDIDVKWEVLTLSPADGGVNVEAVNVQAVNAGSLFVPAKGRIDPEFTKTNSLGVATATYCPPGNDWVLNDQEIIIPTVII